MKIEIKINSEMCVKKQYGTIKPSMFNDELQKHNVFQNLLKYTNIGVV